MTEFQVYKSKGIHFSAGISIFILHFHTFSRFNLKPIEMCLITLLLGNKRQQKMAKTTTSKTNIIAIRANSLKS